MVELSFEYQLASVAGIFILLAAATLWAARREYRMHARLSAIGIIAILAVFVVQAILAGLAFWGVQGFHWPAFGPLVILGILLILAGLGVLIAALHAVGSFRRSLGRFSGPLITTGIYGLTRHPQYVSYGLVQLGAMLIWWTPFAWVGIVSYLLFAAGLIWIEEEHLHRAFGQAYRDYCRQTAIFPGLPKK
jgi:protein-S-isoprenylcysteine O-methyltransferase Ste14